MIAVVGAQEVYVGSQRSTEDAIKVAIVVRVRFLDVDSTVKEVDKD